jgi:hypothetical protein
VDRRRVRRLRIGVLRADRHLIATAAGEQSRRSYATNKNPKNRSGRH